MPVSNTAVRLKDNETNSNCFVLDDIKPDFDAELMVAKFQPGSIRVEKALRELIEEARPLARPRAAFKVCAIESAPPAPSVYLDGIRFDGALIRDNLFGLDQTFAYVATEGPELASWSEGLSNAGRLFSWPIRYAALKLAEKEMSGLIRSSFARPEWPASFGSGFHPEGDESVTPPLSSMNPGPLQLWPIEQQRPLFELLSPLPELIGVNLQPNCWMTPDLASSGIYFQAEPRFYNCQLCRLEPCTRRRTAYRGLDGWPKRRRNIEACAGGGGPGRLLCRCSI
jgi:hypothetical protein